VSLFRFHRGRQFFSGPCIGSGFFSPAGKGRFDVFDIFCVAMAHHRLGNRAEARGCFDRAVRWVAEQKNLPAQYVKELAAFRAEAEAALASPSGELPADVFAPP
jgi:hypothetical protein